MPNPGKIKEDEAAHLFYLFFMLPRMVSLRLFTQEEADALRTELNDRLHKALNPAVEESAGGTGRYSGSDTTYQEVVSWEVPQGMLGELKEILIVTDDYDHTEVKITVGDKIWTGEWKTSSAMPIIFEDLPLAEGTVVKVEAQSDDGTAIVVDAIIVGKER